ncbi:MAG: hypothetical protein ACI9FW_000612 [Flavobacterium sp.]
MFKNFLGFDRFIASREVKFINKGCLFGYLAKKKPMAEAISLLGLYFIYFMVFLFFAFAEFDAFYLSKFWT